MFITEVRYVLISTKGRYALRIMIDLALHSSEGYIPLPVIAERQNISEKYLESIISILAKAKLVQGVRGKNGGYKLLRKPEEYTAGEILKLTEGTLAPVSCLESSENKCERSEFCLTLPLWKKLDDAINTCLDGVKLSDLIAEK